MNAASRRHVTANLGVHAIGIVEESTRTITEDLQSVVTAGLKRVDGLAVQFAFHCTRELQNQIVGPSHMVEI